MLPSAAANAAHKQRLLKDGLKWRLLAAAALAAGC